MKQISKRIIPLTANILTKAPAGFCCGIPHLVYVFVSCWLLVIVRFLFFAAFLYLSGRSSYANDSPGAKTNIPICCFVVFALLFD
jgi:hypothetical protein